MCGGGKEWLRAGGRAGGLRRPSSLGRGPEGLVREEEGERRHLLVLPVHGALRKAAASVRRTRQRDCLGIETAKGFPRGVGAARPPRPVRGGSGLRGDPLQAFPRAPEIVRIPILPGGRPSSRTACFSCFRPHTRRPLAR